MGVYGETVTVPFRRDSVEVFYRRVIRGSRRVVLCFQVARVRGRLIARVVLIAIQGVGRPIFVLFVRLALEVRRFQFGPSARLCAFFLNNFHRVAGTVEGLIDHFVPIAWPLVVAATQVLINGPAVVRRGRVRARFCYVVRRLRRFHFVGVGVNNFPVVRRDRADLIPVLCLVLANPVVRVATDLSFAYGAMDGVGVKDARSFVQFRAVFQDVQVGAQGGARFILVVCFRCGARVAYPSWYSSRRFALILF